MTRRPAFGEDDAVVFSYGTLRQPEVQQAVFGVALPSRPDRVAGYRLAWVTITDSDVVRISGSDRHPMLHADPGGGAVPGTALTLTAEQLRQADAYEVDDYARIRVVLESGTAAWVYTWAGATA